MNKILKILSILVIGFVMFSCANPSSDSTSGSQPSSPETPVETPSDDPVEETPEVPTYSITFTTKDDRRVAQIITDYLNTLSEFKNREEGTEVMLYKHFYINSDGSEVTKEKVETSVYEFGVYYNAKPGIDSVVIGNEDVEVRVYDYVLTGEY